MAASLPRLRTPDANINNGVDSRSITPITARPALRIREPLFPEPKRCCSRQTGVLVNNYYGHGINPFIKNPTVVGVKPLRQDTRQRHLDKLIAKAKREKEDAKALQGTTICHLPSKQQRMSLERQIKAERLRRERLLAEKNPSRPISQARDDSEVPLVFKRHMEKMERTVMGLGSEGEEKLARELRDVEAKALDKKEQTTMTGLRPDMDDYMYVTSEQYAALHSEFEAAIIDRKFQMALVANTAMIFVGMLVTPAMIRRSQPTGQLEPNFLPLVKQLMPSVPSSFLDRLHDDYVASEEARREAAQDFRNRYDLTTVRDIERSFDQMRARFCSKEHLASSTLEPGMTIREFLKYIGTIRSIGHEEAVKLFLKVSEDPMNSDDGPLLTAEGFAHLVKLNYLH